MYSNCRRFLSKIPVFPVLLIGTFIIWAVLTVLCPSAGQSRLFYEEGRELFSDFAMPRACAQAANPYTDTAVPVEFHDRCYGMAGYVLASVFPIDTRFGGLLFSIVGVLLFILALLVLRNRYRDSGWLMVIAVLLSSPVLFSLERANQIWIAAAGVMLFLVWHDSEQRWRRLAAVLALALASALKITPAVFSLLLLKQKRWSNFVIFVIAGAFMTLVPFAAWCGIGAVGDWVARMHEHVGVYHFVKNWGVPRLIRLGAIFLGQSVHEIPALIRCGQLVDILVGALAFTGAIRTTNRRNEVLLLAAVIVFAPKVSQYYTVLYFIPALVMSCGRKSWFESLSWFVILCPLQIFVRGLSWNPTFANIALMVLVLYVAVTECFPKLALDRRNA